MADAAVPRAARSVRAEWQRLVNAGASPPRLFDPADLGPLPEPVRRWVRHSIAPGASLATTTRLSMHGEIRLGRWRPFTATQVLAPPNGFIWAATARVARIPVTGFDRYSSRAGQMRWRLLGFVPAMSAAGPVVDHSAAGRLAIESTVLLPTGYQQPDWSAVQDPQTATAKWNIDGHEEQVAIRVDAAGRLVEASMHRWGTPDNEPPGRYPFGVTLRDERTFAGITIPTTIRAGWWWGTDRQDQGEFFRARITDAVFR